MDEDIKPSPRFIEILSQFKGARFGSLQNKENAAEKAKFNKFYVFYNKWKVQMGLVGLSRDDAMKLMNVHPWKQLKEKEGDGIEMLKNRKTRRYWKVQHTLEKLTPSRLNRPHNQNAEKMETDKIEKITEK